MAEHPSSETWSDEPEITASSSISNYCNIPRQFIALSYDINIVHRVESAFLGILELRIYIPLAKDSTTLCMGVLQGSVLGPTLWNLLYDGVLEAARGMESRLVAYADDLAAVVTGDTKRKMVENANKVLSAVDAWMRDHSLNLAPEKTEAILLTGMRRAPGLAFNLGGTIIMPKKEVKYLGVTIDKGRTFGPHVQKICDKAERTAVALAKLMPNIGGPRQQKRVVMARVVESGMLYAASIWADAVQIGRYRERLLKAQRKMTLRIASAYRTVSTDAAGVIAGVLPMDLMVEQRRECHMSVQRGMEVKEAKKVSRERAHAKWQERWNASTKAAWTRRLIPEIDKWLGRRHGEVCYQTTQFLHRMAASGCTCTELGSAARKIVYIARVETPQNTLSLLVRDGRRKGPK
ncbi:hypothetical protein NQ315_008754 [Exocentrus adspersus]|uniref:Reverse transcriptase domain-containing protein n=1 Tax=Exocentrus adspersus TaxID=1586481 RepID=A0AAV8VGL1_9CUCU|nr:hypothetical protein NQ315_008754 [Exocentrus adspersus]